MIYHITNENKWEDAKLKGWYYTDSLNKQGFIHCSYKEQLIKVANCNYKSSDNLIILEINEGSLKSKLVLEDLYDSGESYPHIYGLINVSSVVSVHIFNKNKEEGFVLPDELKKEILEINGNNLSMPIH